MGTVPIGDEFFTDGDRVEVTLPVVVKEGEVHAQGASWDFPLTPQVLSRVTSVRKIEPPINNGDLFTSGGRSLFVKVDDGYKLVRHHDGSPALRPGTVHDLRKPLTRVTVTPA